MRQLSAADAEHPAGSRVFRGNEVDFDQYGYCRDERNQNLKASEYGAQIDPMGLRIVLNEYYRRYHLPLIITENALAWATSSPPTVVYMMIIVSITCASMCRPSRMPSATVWR